MFTPTQRPLGGAKNLSHPLSYEARLNQLHRLFKTHHHVTEPSMIIEPYLFLGNCITAQDVHRLSRLGIRYVLNVAQRDVELCPYYSKNMRTLTIDLRDDDREDIVRVFDQAFTFIDEARKAKSRVLVHCSHGQSRSPAVVVGYLMRTYNASLEQCLMQVIKARPSVIPNDGFLKQLILFDLFLIERRRKKEEAAILKAYNDAMSTEIPIQHHSPVASEPAQPSAPPIITPPECPGKSASDTADMSSEDSANMGKSSRSGIRPSVSTSSIRVIPIQIPLEEPSLDKMDSVPEKRISITGEAHATDTKKKVNKLEKKRSATKLSKESSKDRLDSPSTYNVSPSKRRSSSKKTKDIKQDSYQIPRSSTSYFNHSYINHRINPLITLTPQQWNFIHNYPVKHHGFNKFTRTNYITEVYDSATDRFIPTTCCY